MKRGIVFSVMMGAALALSACEQNPYPKSGQLVETQPQENPADPVFAIDAPDQTECFEAQPCKFKIVGIVPAPGTPIMKVDGLPEGSTFDPATGEFSWSPTLETVVPGRNTLSGELTFYIRITLHSSAERIRVTTKMLALKVLDQARPLSVSFRDTDELFKERQAQHFPITIASQDFPSGPFEVTFKGAPAGTIVKADPQDITRWSVDFTAPADFVGLSDPADGSGTHYKEFAIELSVRDPGGNQFVLPVRWRVQDAAEAPMVQAPESIKARKVVVFVVNAWDLNGETRPVISLDGNPLYGVPTLTALTDPPYERGVNMPGKSMMVRWGANGMPDATKTLKLKACVRSGSDELCTKFSVDVEFSSSFLGVSGGVER